MVIAMVASHGAGARAQSLQESLDFMIQDHKRIRAAEADVAAARDTAIALSLPFIPSMAETLEFCITTGYPFRHA